MHILLVEDNHEIAKQIIGFLEGHHWTVDYAATGKQGIHLALTQHFDVIVLDLNLPDTDGLEVCKNIKQDAETNIPILMLTARDAFEDKVKGFGNGAVDYLTKPFDLRELALRCEAMARRPQLHTQSVTSQGPLTLDARAHIATWNMAPLKLTNVGFLILQKLITSYPYPVSRSELIQQVWGDAPPESNALKSHMYSLRKSFEEHTDMHIVTTISNIGYVLKGLDDKT